MYFITTVNEEGSRCVGYVGDEQDAIGIVVDNIGDLYEAGYYPYAVIENIPQGIYQYDTNPMWFRYDITSNKYKSCDIPLFVRKYNTIGWAIG